MKQITYNEYISLLDEAIKLNPKVRFNCEHINNDVSRMYFKSEEGCSYLSHDYYIGGIFRFVAGSEKIVNVHLEHLKSLGGYFLECYEGYLSNAYALQGFNIVSRLMFEPTQAKQGWERDTDLRKFPNVIFMSLYPTKERYFIRYKDNYRHAYKYAKQSILK